MTGKQRLKKQLSRASEARVACVANRAYLSESRSRDVFVSERRLFDHVAEKLKRAIRVPREHAQHETKEVRLNYDSDICSELFKLLCDLRVSPARCAIQN